jgi:hypothetical protein
MCNEPEHVTQTVLHQLVNLSFVLDRDLEQPPASPTATGHLLGLNPVFPPERIRHKTWDGSVPHS